MVLSVQCQVIRLLRSTQQVSLTYPNFCLGGGVASIEIDAHPLFNFHLMNFNSYTIANHILVTFLLFIIKLSSEKGHNIQNCLKRSLKLQI